MQEDTHDARFDPPGEKTWPGASKSRRASLILALLLLSSYAVTDYMRSHSGPRWLMILTGVIGFGLAILRIVFHRTADSADGNGPYSPPSNITR